MSDAIIAKEVYKKFGSTSQPFWKQLPVLKAWGNGQSHNGNGKHALKPGSNGKSGANGAKKVIVAVDRVSFTVRQGEIFGVLGPNGSGKSTLIRLVATLLLPDEGSMQVFGYDVVRQPMEVQRLINRVSVEASFFKKLSPMENLIYGARQ